MSSLQAHPIQRWRWGDKGLAGDKVEQCSNQCQKTGTGLIKQFFKQEKCRRDSKPGRTLGAKGVWTERSALSFSWKPYKDGEGTSMHNFKDKYRAPRKTGAFYYYYYFWEWLYFLNFFIFIFNSLISLHSWPLLPDLPPSSLPPFSRLESTFLVMLVLR